MTERPDIEARLRDSLAEHARQAPDGSLLAEQVVAAVGTRPARRRTWLMPVLAAGAVAAVAGALVGVVHARQSAAPRPLPPGGSHSTTVPTVPTAVPSTAGAPTPTPTPTPTTATSTSPASRPTSILDLSFVGPDAFALTRGTLYRSADSGASWSPAGGVPLNAGHVRFATPDVGYAYGPDALYLTRDGGHSWTDQPGGALALETLDNNVIRVSTTCLPGCPMLVQTAAIGGSTWTTTATISPGMSPGVTLARTGGYAYLAVYGHTAGGAQNATTALWVSADAGATWTERGEPCPQSPGETDTTLLSTATDGTVGVICTPRQAGAGWQFPMTSPAGGAAFAAGNRQAFGNGSVGAFALASARVLVVSLADGTYRSTDGGTTFSRLGANSGSDPGPLQWLGFASPTVGHGLSQDGRTVWTTTDAGATWTPARLP